MAYLVLTTDHAKEWSIRDTREALKMVLPEHMLPSLYVILDEFPLTVTGKVDRKYLSQLKISSSPTESEYVPPQTPFEKLLTSIWSEVLGVDENALGVHETFLDLRGNSVLAMKIMARVFDEFSIELAPMEFFSASTIAEMSQLVLEQLLQDEDLEEGMDLIGE